MKKGTDEPDRNVQPIAMSNLARAFLDQSRTYLKGEHMPRIEKALAALSEEDFWWRPNEASNSAGNLVLHLAGNVRQWIVHGLGGEVDVRERDEEFAAKGGVSKAEALAQLHASVDDACAVLEQMDADGLRGNGAGSHLPRGGALRHAHRADRLDRQRSVGRGPRLLCGEAGWSRQADVDAYAGWAGLLASC